MRWNFLRCYDDLQNESDSIWGIHWPYIIEASTVWKLYRSFDITLVKVSDKNYGRGAMRFVYVDPADVRTIIEKGYLAGNDSPDALRPIPS